MAVSYEYLLNYPVPEIVQDVGADDAAFYALSVGFGQDPLDERELAFVDPVPSIIPVPSMALVLAYPGFWLGRADTGLDAAKIAHVEQEVILHKPLPVPARISGRTQVAGLFARASGKGLVLQSERRLVDMADGSLVATLRQMHFLQGDSCDDAPPFRASDPVLAPSGSPSIRVKVSTRPEQALLYRLNGDMNRLHIDPAVASRAGFDQPILHGMCTFGIVTRAVLAAMCGYQTARIGSISMRFRAPVFPGETLRVDLWPCGALQVVSLERGVTVIDVGRVTLATRYEFDGTNAMSVGDEKAQINMPEIT